MRSLALILTLLLASCANQSLIAHGYSSWKYARLTAAGMDTLAILSDSVELSRTLYMIAYGSPDKRFPNQLLKTIDSTKMGQVVGRILKDTSQWNLQVISPQGKLISPEMIDWKSLTAKNLPYRLRQSTGCNNALGVIKFDLDSPYDVYLHDTNHRELLSKKYRFLGHGCIRVAEPAKLANFLMEKEWLSDAFTEARYHNLPSKSYPLPHTIPVVITYTLVEADAGLVYYQDIYNALANKPITFTR